jgi:hypothetical protein
MLTRITTAEGGVIDLVGTIVETVELNDDGTPIVVEPTADDRLLTLEERQAATEAELAAARADATAARAEAAASVQRAARDLVVDADLPEAVAVPI